MIPFTQAEPLGPIDHALLSDEYKFDILDVSVQPFKDAIARSAILVLGRKGAGKSALLAEYKRYATGRNRPSFKVDALPARGDPYIISIPSWQHFSKMVETVNGRISINEALMDIIPVERYTEEWKAVIWNEIVEHFFDYAHGTETRSALSAVSDFVNGVSFSDLPATKAAEQLFQKAKDQILSFLKYRNSRLLILFDSMDNYPTRKALFARILSGFFQALYEINHTSDLIDVTFCIPEEIESHFTANSANVLKDFSSSCRIRWRPIELLQIICHRYRKCLEVHDREHFETLADLEFSNREHVHRLFNRLLPQEVTNCLGEEEDTLAYIMRHTQLLPRHMIYIFNTLLSRSFAATGGFRFIDGRTIVEGIKEAEMRISDQILTPYKAIFPILLDACSSVLPEVEPICRFKSLKGVEERFKLRIDEEVFSVSQTLFQMGVLGKVVPNAGQRPAYIKTSRYALAEFCFNSYSSSLSCQQDDEVCFHPVFSRTFGMKRSDPDEKRVIYPAGVDFVALD